MTGLLGARREARPIRYPTVARSAMIPPPVTLSHALVAHGTQEVADHSTYRMGFGIGGFGSDGCAQRADAGNGDGHRQDGQGWDACAVRSAHGVRVRAELSSASVYVDRADRESVARRDAGGYHRSHRGLTSVV